MAVVVAGLLVIAACSGGSDDDASASTDPGAPTTAAAAGQPATTDLPSCTETAHAAVFDLSALILDSQELAKWQADFAYDMAVRPAAPELVNAFKARGYRIVYLTALPSDSTIGPEGAAMSAEITAWQRRHDFPTGEGTTLLMWDQQAYADANTYRIDAMVQLSLGGTALDFGYTDDENDVRAFRNAGMPVERIFTVKNSTGTPGTAGVPLEDLGGHKAMFIDPLPPICRL